MPIKIPSTLPARETLEAERIPLILEDRAIRQDIRPLRIALLNLMPDKIRTESQLLRLLGATPLQIEMTLLRIGSHESKNTAKEHLAAFYETLDDVKGQRFDALIVTGAPVEHLDYGDVTYWPELQAIFDWADKNVYSSFFICWGAQAALNHYHGVPKHAVPAKKFGVFDHKILMPFHPLIAGFDDDFPVPVSRNTEIRHADAAKVAGLDILAEADETGICLAFEEAKRRVYMFNHLEYDAETLAREYFRDREAGMDTALPHNYFPDNDPAKTPHITWRAHRTLLFCNWINMVYQGTPYDLKDL
ncbi:MAG: homoserine O-succinyltransferase [Proteobacteria bacterium]|nr:homoserine O-succinyltransferase [Pseudomonadota bacterium]